MIKNLTTNQLLLVALAAVLLLIAAFAFFLLENPTAPLPFAPPPATNTPTSPSSAIDATAIPNTPTPTRRTSYTPLFPYETPTPGTPSASTTQLMPTEQGTVQATLPYPNPPQPSPPSTLVITGTPPTGTSGPSPTSGASPTATRTLTAGEVSVTGRVLKNGTPVPNVVVSFEDDVAARQSTTNTGGHYSFITLAPGTYCILTFEQSDNPGLTPTTEIASLAWITGALPTNTNPIEIPDLEVSINLNEMIFQPNTPVDGAAYSANIISVTNPLQFSWSLYSVGGSYSVELGPNGEDQPVWISGQVTSTSTMWNGTLADGTHITTGNYWWRVAVTKSLGNYSFVVYTQLYDLIIN
jgi:hypothetical protein